MPARGRPGSTGGFERLGSRARAGRDTRAREGGGERAVREGDRIRRRRTRRESARARARAEEARRARSRCEAWVRGNSVADARVEVTRVEGSGSFGGKRRCASTSSVNEGASAAVGACGRDAEQRVRASGQRAAAGTVRAAGRLTGHDV